MERDKERFVEQGAPYDRATKLKVGDRVEHVKTRQQGTVVQLVLSKTEYFRDWLVQVQLDETFKNGKNRHKWDKTSPWKIVSEVKGGKRIRV